MAHHLTLSLVVFVFWGFFCCKETEKAFSCRFTGFGAFFPPNPPFLKCFWGFLFLLLLFLLPLFLFLSFLSIFHFRSSPSPFSCFPFFFLSLSFFSCFLLPCFFFWTSSFSNPLLKPPLLQCQCFLVFLFFFPSCLAFLSCFSSF